MTSILKTSTLLATLLLAAACGSAGVMQDDPTTEVDPENPVNPEEPTDPEDPEDPDELPLVGPCSVTTGVFGLAVDLQGADGSVLESTLTTTSAGVAAFDECPRDSLLTFVAYEEKLDGWRGVTIPGVQPHSHFDVRLPSVGWQGTLVTHVPDDGSSLTATRLHAGARCAANAEQGTSEEMAITADCLGEGGVMPVIATARIDDVWVYAHSETDPTFTTYGVTNIAEDNMTNWTTGGSVSLSVINAPTPAVGFKMQWVRNGQGYGAATWIANLVDDVATRVIPVAPSSFSTTRRVGVASNGTSREGYIMQTTESVVELDFVNALGGIGDVIFDKTDIARPTFTLSGIDSEADLGIIRLRWMTEADQEVIWRVLVPTKEMTTVAFPALSDDLEEVRPNETFELQEMYLIDMTGDAYEGILSAGYRIGANPMECGSVTDASMCRFAYAHLNQ